MSLSNNNDFIESYKRLFVKSGLDLDNQQKNFMLFLSGYYQDLRKFFRKRAKSFFSLWIHKPKNLYLYGSVGIGKSLMLKSFLLKLVEDGILPEKKLLQIHLHQFLLMVHNKLSSQRKLNNDKDGIIKEIVNDFAKEFSLIYLDEFAVNDIVDAMLLGKLLEELNKQKIIIITSSNLVPKDLYKDGVQRESFLPTISFIQENYFIYHLSSDKDYRSFKLSDNNNVKLVTTSTESEMFLSSILSWLGVREFKQKKLHFLGRDLYIAKSYMYLSVFTFDELFSSDINNNDYEQILNNFQVIVIKDVREIQKDEKNILRRFINFIDLVFEKRTKLIIITYVNLQEIYPNKSNVFELTRTLSRLDEISYTEYNKGLKESVCIKEELNENNIISKS